ncbi:Maltose acetyltransferase [Schaereria dolodes]|nr:Maltose acetyltransferase [Schaereria dolodes]
MAAVASNQMPEGLRALDHEQFLEASSSRFTAVNGRVSPVAPINAAARMMPSAEEHQIIANEDQVSRQVQQVNIQGRQVSPVQPQRDEYEQNSVRAENHACRDSHMGTPSSQRAKSPDQSPLKRKRSDSEDIQNPNIQPYHGHGFPTIAEARSGASPDMQGPRNILSDSTRDRSMAEYQREPRPLSSEPYGRPRSNPPHQPRVYEPPPPLSSDYNPHAQPNQQERPYYTHHHDASEARLAEALQRENHNSYGQTQIRDQYGSPEDDEQRRHQYGEYSANRSSVSGADAERKRRKRVFSNRTKTGCMTCRKRKKKCDEAHPECNNCLRGGFVCEGYTTRNTWQKPTPAKAPIPLQSKNGYADISHHDQHSRSHHSNDVSPEYARASISQQQIPATDGDRVKPIVLDEDRDHRHSLTSPSMTHGKSTWSKVTRPYPSHPPHLSKYHPEDEHRPIPSVHELPPELPDPAAIYPTTTSHRTHSSHPAHPAHPIQPPALPNPYNAPAVAQAALQRTPSSQRPSPHHRNQPTEREKMLKGEYFLPYTPALTQDREQCAAAVCRFNNAANPATGVGPEERLRLFNSILKLQPSQEPSPGPGSDGRNSTESTYFPTGSVGPGVVVEAPFYCDYGYNINIGENVLIGPDCRITDACMVTIGNNVVFSPSVKLVCVTYPIDPKDRRKGKGRALGRNIVIEDDVWIGSNVTILPGAKIGRCSTVGAGCVIHKEVPPYTVVAGNPQKVVRGIYDAHSSRD